MNFSLVIPTYNPGKHWRACVNAILRQDIKPRQVIVIDSGSHDDCVIIAHDAGFRVESIEHASFNHGATRNLGVRLCGDVEFVVFLTQDAVLVGEVALSAILSSFDDPSVAAAYGRQLPARSAGVIESHARLYNYPGVSSVKSYSDSAVYGMKAVFLSNSFAAYRVSTLTDVGGFPENVIFGEDMYVAARVLKSGGKIAYVAEACVYHSHSYSFKQEIQRYFDMGVFHAREPWLRKEFGTAEKEGVRFVISEFKHLMKHALWRVPEGFLRTLLRYLGFKLGLLENCLPLAVKKYLSMNKGYFNKS